MTFCGPASAWSKVALIVSLVAFGLHMGGFLTNSWMARSTVRDTTYFKVGLWKMTNCSTCSEFGVSSEYATKNMNWTRGLESLSLLLLLVTWIGLAIYVAFEWARSRRAAVLLMLASFSAAVFSIAGMVLWIRNLPTYFYISWSMGLTVFAMTLSVTSSILLIPDITQYEYTNDTKDVDQFQNLSVTEAAMVGKKQLMPEPIVEGKVELKPKIIPQRPLAAPSYQFMQYNTKKLHDGF